MQAANAIKGMAPPIPPLPPRRVSNKSRISAPRSFHDTTPRLLTFYTVLPIEIPSLVKEKFYNFLFVFVHVSYNFLITLHSCILYSRTKKEKSVNCRSRPRIVEIRDAMFERLWRTWVCGYIFLFIFLTAPIHDSADDYSGSSVI